MPFQIQSRRQRPLLTSETDCKSRGGCLSLSAQAIVKAHVEELLQKGFIAPSKSADGALVEKKGGKSRMCVDYRALNKITVKVSTVPPLMSDCLTSRDI